MNIIYTCNSKKGYVKFVDSLEGVFKDDLFNLSSLTLTTSKGLESAAFEFVEAGKAKWVNDKTIDFNFFGTEHFNGLFKMEL